MKTEIKIAISFFIIFIFTMIFFLFKSENFNNKYNIKPITVNISTYQALKAQTDSDPETCSCGKISHVRNNKIVAISRDLFRDYFNCGDEIYIEIEENSDYNGWYTVYDSMNSRFTSSVDMLTDGDNFKLKGKIIKLKRK